MSNQLPEWILKKMYAAVPGLEKLGVKITSDHYDLPQNESEFALYVEENSKEPTEQDWKNIMGGMWIGGQ